MKKILFLTSLLALVFTMSLVSCDKDDDKDAETYPLNPPAWLQGTWESEDEYLNLKTTLVFTAHNITESIEDEDGKETINYADEIKKDNIKVKETSTDAAYTVSLDGVTIVTIKKIDATHMEDDGESYTKK